MDGTGQEGRLQARPRRAQTPRAAQPLRRRASPVTSPSYFAAEPVANGEASTSSGATKATPSAPKRECLHACCRAAIPPVLSGAACPTC